MKKNKRKRKVYALIEFNDGSGYLKEYILKNTLKELRKQIKKRAKRPVKRIKFFKKGNGKLIKGGN